MRDRLGLETKVTPRTSRVTGKALHIILMFHVIFKFHLISDENQVKFGWQMYVINCSTFMAHLYVLIIMAAVA